MRTRNEQIEQGVSPAPLSFLEINPDQVHDVDSETVRSWMRKGEAVLIDVREEEEHAEERIPGATLLPLSRFDPSFFPQTLEKKIVLHCLVGSRAQKAAKILAASGFRQVFHMEGGLLAWIAAGGETRGTP